MKLLVFDIGGTAVKYAVMENAAILSKGEEKTPAGGREALMDLLQRIYEENGPAEGVSVSMPGIIDSERGYCFMGGSLTFHDDFFFADCLSGRLGVRVVIENDAKCAALAEAVSGSLADAADGFVLLFGTNIGGALIIGHRLYRGKHFSAGEVTYLCTEKDGPVVQETAWGKRCGVPVLCRNYAERKGLDPSAVNGRTVFEAVNKGDPEAAAVLDAYTREIAVQIFNIQTVFDPEKIAIGGGISAQPAFTGSIRRNLAALYDSCPYPVTKAEIVPCAYRNDANLIGAFHSFVQAAGASDPV